MSAPAPVPNVAPERDVLTPIFQELLDYSGVASLLGEKNLAKNHAPPQYVWVPDQVIPLSPYAIGEEPRTLAHVELRFGVHCWAKTFDAAFLMIGPLLTTVREAVGAGMSRFEPGAISNNHESLNGWVFVLNVNLLIPAYEATLAGDEYVRAPVLSVGFDTSNAVEGDGVMTAPGV